MTEQEKYMKAALKLAHKAAEEGEVPVGAVVVCDGKIVGRGRNRRETKKNALHHAEIEAIEKACKKLGGWRLHRCDLYVTLEPCPMCAGAIINARIKTVYFGAFDRLVRFDDQSVFAAVQSSAGARFRRYGGAVCGRAAHVLPGASKEAQTHQKSTEERESCGGKRRSAAGCVL